MQDKFSHKVLNIVRKIPSGKTMSYGEIAKLAGNPKAYRAVGSIMRKNWNISIPCHRVVLSDRNVGQYNRGGKEKKIELLKAEGVML